MAVLGCLAGPGRAQDPSAVAADRPGFGDGSAVVAPGRLQAEAGYGYSDFGPVEGHAIGQLVLRLGLVERVEVRALVNSYVLLRGGAAVEGFEDVALGAKVNVLAGDGRPLGQPALTAIVNVFLPTGDDAFSNGHLRPEARLALDLGLTPALAFSANVGYAFDLGDEPETLYVTYAALGAPVPGVDGLGAFAGLYTLTHSTTLFLKEVRTDYGLDGGFTYLPDPATQLDLTVGLGLTNGVPDFSLGAGVARRF